MMENESKIKEKSCWKNIFCEHINPNVIFLFLTIFITCTSTSLLCAAIMTENWEKVFWNWDSVELLTKNQSKFEIEWVLNKTAMRIFQKDYELIAFLVPMNGGIWTLCIDLGTDQFAVLEQFQLPRKKPCINYLAEEGTLLRKYNVIRSFWQHRMQNLSISCALVCLIVLGSAALVGAFGIFKHQICAVLITGVMYFLAATFALFVLIILHFKRMKSNMKTFFDDSIDGVVILPNKSQHQISQLLSARIFDTSWSLLLAWAGVFFCFFTSLLWIFLSKIMRFNALYVLIL